MRGLKGAFLIASAACTFAQVPAVLFDGNTPRNGVGTRGTYGWEFTVQSPIRVTALGVYDNQNFIAPNSWGVPGDGLNESHAVGIWRLLQTSSPFLTAVVPTGTQATLQDSFRYVPVTPTDLEPGTYVIGMYNSGVNLDYSVLPGQSTPPFTPTAAPGITVGNRRMGDTPVALGFPDITDTQNLGDFGPNFLFQVPEPSVMALGAAGIVVFGAQQRLRRRCG
jgi:hypothetical protein